MCKSRHYYPNHQTFSIKNYRKTIYLTFFYKSDVDPIIYSISQIHAIWKIQSELTPRANVSLTPENFLILPP